MFSAISLAAHDIAQEGAISVVVLVTGLVVVFCVLIALTFIIDGYARALHKLQNKQETPKQQPTPVSSAPAPVFSAPAPAQTENGIPAEVAAVIAAAVYSTYGISPAAIKSVRRAATGANRSAWGMAGMLESTRPF